MQRGKAWETRGAAPLSRFSQQEHGNVWSLGDFTGNISTAKGHPFL